MHNQAKVWVVDDDSSIRWVLEKAMTQAGIPITAFASADHAMHHLHDERPSAVITDVRMPGMSGLALLERLRSSRPDLPIIVITAHSDLENAVAAYKGGAFEYLPKPFDIDEAVALVRRALQHASENSRDNEVSVETGASEIIGEAPAMQEVFIAIGRLSRSSISVLINGQSGTGKELVAHALHKHSPRAANPFIALNMAAIPADLVESELFGHEKGAFTGATQDRKGYFEVADGGTIFLDEVGELPLTTQVRLLRVLENGEFIKVGSSKVLKTNVRIVAATNVNMQSAIEKEKFREDLYYRLSTVEINLPALRERNEDIHLLFRKFASDFAQKYRMPSIRLDENAVNVLLNYRFPGNIRQLKNLAEQISVIEENRTVSASKLQQYLPNNNGNLPAVIGGKKENDFSTERDIMYKILFDMRNDINDLKKLTLDLMKNGNIDEVQEEHHQLIEKIYRNQESQNTNVEVLNIPQETSTEKDYDFIETIEEDENLSLQEKEIEMIKKSLEKNNNKRKLAAQELGISERTLYRKIKQYDL